MLRNHTCCSLLGSSSAVGLPPREPSQALSPTLHLPPLPAAPPQTECRHGLPGTHAAASAARLLLPSCLSGPPGATWRRQWRAGGRQQGGACSAGLHLQPHIAGQLLQPAGGGVAALLQVRGHAWVAAVPCCGGMLVHGQAADDGGRAVAARCVAMAARLLTCLPPRPLSASPQGHRTARVCLRRPVWPAGPLHPPLPGLHSRLCSRGCGPHLAPRGGCGARPRHTHRRRGTPPRQAPRLCTGGARRLACAVGQPGAAGVWPSELGLAGWGGLGRPHAPVFRHREEAMRCTISPAAAI